MKAAIYEEFQGPILVREVPDSVPKDHGVVIRVMATGLCRSDWHGWMGHDPDIKLPHVPGHELAGLVHEVGDQVKNFKTGDRVTVPFVCGCGTCPQCRSGHHQVCDHQSQPGFTHWGSFAEYVAIDHADINLVSLPEKITFDTAAALGCRFITAFRGIVDQAKLLAGESVAVHGCGGVGLSAIMIAKAMGATVIAIDINEKSLQLARSVGASHTVNARSENDVVTKVREMSSGGVHVSMDALGSQETCFNSISNLRKRGRHIQVGLMTGDHQQPKIPMDQVLAHELEVIGSHGMQAHRYPEMLEMIILGKLQPEKLVMRSISLVEVPEVLPSMNDHKAEGVTVINSF